MILIVDRTGGYWRGWVFSDSLGIPISGASVGLRMPVTRRYRAMTTANPQGYWSFEGYESVLRELAYTLEVINGPEMVTIDGEQVHVVTVEMARERRRQEAEADRPAKTPWYRRMWGLQ